MSETKKSVSLNSFYAVKAGMTRIFDKEGNHVPVTVLKLIPNLISQVKTVEKDGYEAYQVSFNEKRPKLVSKPRKSHLAKAGIQQALSKSAEIKAKVDVANIGGQLSYEEFKPQTYIDISGISKGKGFQGVMKRYNFQGGPAAHGSMFHRTTGAIGNRANPARVFAEKKLPGHMGDEVTTVQNLIVVDVNIEKGFMLIKGSVPGSKNGFVRVSKAIKK